MSSKIENHKQCPQCRATVRLVADSFGQVVSLELVASAQRQHGGGGGGGGAGKAGAGKHGHRGKGKRGRRQRGQDQKEGASLADPVVRAGWGFEGREGGLVCCARCAAPSPAR